MNDPVIDKGPRKRGLDMRYADLNKFALLCSALLISAGLVQHQHGWAKPSRFDGASGQRPKMAGDKPTKSEGVEGNDPWSLEELIEPADLARLLSGRDKPVVIQIGIVYLYRLAHVPGSKFAGPASSTEGVDALKKQVQDLARSTQVVCYCGCCPWGDCPNIRPAYKALSEMGFKKIKMLHLANNFSQDWATKGLPVEKGGG